MHFVIDTNVIVVTNGKSVQASNGCVMNCMEKLMAIKENGIVVIDDQWRIVKEYKNNMNESGQPGFGDAFLRWLLTNTANPSRCQQMRITSKNREDNDFQEFPNDSGLQGFDPGDRKFIAVANAHPQKPPVLQAVDLKWWKYRDIFKNHGITIEFLCPIKG